ncbi:MAG: hypothetical protein HY796_06425 [Elusimicrobia bacterium]|nr:hypothetical protein [Elusimicrobiota bacterium]
MAETPETFLVFAAEERLPDFLLVTQIISKFLGLSREEAAQGARHSWGFLGEDLSGEKALKLLEICGFYGIEAVKIPTAARPELELPLRITKLGLEPDKLVYSEANGQSDTMPKENIRVLSAAPLKTETLRTTHTTEGPSIQEKAVRLGIMAVTGLPIGLGKSKEVRKEVKSSETSFYMDLILDGGGRLRFCSDNFDFSHLAAERTYSSQLNFRLMAAKLAAFAPKALKNAGLWAILENKPLSPLPYDSMDDFELESLRLLAVVKAKGCPPNSPAGPPSGGKT